MSTNETSYLLFVGTYTNFDILAHLPHNDKVGNGVYCMNFENGSIEMLAQVPCVNPAVLHFDQRDVNTLYVLSEGIVENGLIHTVHVKPHVSSKTGKVSISTNSDFADDSAQTGGKSLCYFGTNGKHGIAINYWQGSVDVFELSHGDEPIGVCKEKGILQHIEHNDIATKIEKMSHRRQVKHREDHWVNRQCGSHAHSSHFWKKWVFIPDLGDNSVYQYRYYENGKNGDPSKVLDYECQIALKYGCGPRHMVFHPSLPVVYVSNELNSTITVLLLNDGALDSPRAVPRMTPIQYVSTISKSGHSTQKDSKNYVAEICVSPDGRDLYVSNRGHDTIAHFRVDLGNQGRVREHSKQFISTYGQCPRHFAMAPDGRFMVVANQDTNSITSFERDPHDGSLTYKAQFVDKHFGAPNFLLFYPIANRRLRGRSTTHARGKLALGSIKVDSMRGGAGETPSALGRMKKVEKSIAAHVWAIPALLVLAALLGVFVLFKLVW